MKGPMPDEKRLAALCATFDDIGARLDRLEVARAGSGGAHAIELQFKSFDDRLSKLEASLGVVPAQSTARQGTSSCALRRANKVPSASPLPPDESDTYKRLHQDLVKRGATNFRFVRVTGPYYEESLQFRAQRLNADSTDQLCKTMVMENTKVTEQSDDPRLSKYFLVLVQYTAAIDAEKLKAFVHKIANEASSLSKSKINMRMTSDDVAKELTGYGHNAVTPLCSRTKLPIIMSDRISQLQGLFFMGAGEVDLKVGMPASEFLRAYQDGPVFVVDCTTNR